MKLNEKANKANNYLKRANRHIDKGKDLMTLNKVNNRGRVNIRRDFELT